MHLQSAVLSELTGFPSFYSLLGHFYHLATNLEREMPGSSVLFSQACRWWLHSLTVATVLQFRDRQFWRVGRKEAMGMLLIVFTLELVSKKVSLLVRKHSYVFFLRGGDSERGSIGRWRLQSLESYRSFRAMCVIFWGYIPQRNLGFLWFLLMASHSHVALTHSVYRESLCLPAKGSFAFTSWGCACQLTHPYCDPLYSSDSVWGKWA